MKKTRVEGDADLRFTFKGRYNAAKKQQPDLGMVFKVNNGVLAYNNTPASMEKLRVDVNATLPSAGCKPYGTRCKSV
jgi:AsmA protein